MPDNPLFKIRPLKTNDASFLYNSWLKSYRDSPMVKSVPNSIYYANHHAIVEDILHSPALSAFIACNPEDADQIYGYLVGERFTDQTILHWVYCKHPFRGNGISKALLEAFQPAPTSQYSHRVKNIEKLLAGRAYVFNPYLLRVPNVAQSQVA